MAEDQQGQIAKIFIEGYKDNLFGAEKLAQEVKDLIDEAVKHAAKLANAVKDPSKIDFSKMPILRGKLEKAIAKLRSQMQSKIEEGSKEAWQRAASTNATVITAIAASNQSLADALQQGYTDEQGLKALEAFQSRKTNGMNLSARVWNLTAKMQADIEQGIETALACGKPAQKLSQEIRNCLNDPDNYFRRFRYKGADGTWQRKWKRRYWDDASQSYKWKDVNLGDYSYGPGVYRSSYKNAMRLARTEVNMAYHASDTDRWRSSWWVKGIRISLSNNHTTTDGNGHRVPLTDICDDLYGDYPKDFDFTGWHPQCRCFAHAITATSAEIKEYMRRKKAGEDMSQYQIPGTVTQPPAAFSRWLEDNSERLAKGAARGATPYFVARNPKYCPGIKIAKGTDLAPEAEKSLTILEAAEIRHSQRTEAQVEKIQARWDQHRRKELESRMKGSLSLKQYETLEKELGNAGMGLLGNAKTDKNVISAVKAKMDTFDAARPEYNRLITEYFNTKKTSAVETEDFSSIDMFSARSINIGFARIKRRLNRKKEETDAKWKEWYNNRLERAKEDFAKAGSDLTKANDAKASAKTKEETVKAEAQIKQAKQSQTTAKVRIARYEILLLDKAKDVVKWLESHYPSIQMKFDDMAKQPQTLKEFAISASEHLIRYPELKKKINMLGSIKEQFEYHKQEMLKEAEKKHKIKYKRDFTEDEKKAELAAITRQLDREGRSPGTNTSTYAYSDPKDTYKGNGTFWNSEEFPYSKAISSIKRNIKSKWHPVGTASVKAMIDHEFGHKIDELLDLRNNKIFKIIHKGFQDITLKKKKNKKYIINNLSEYGTKNEAEFIAEAWSEYKNNPKPRVIAKYIGRLIEKLMATD